MQQFFADEVLRDGLGADDAVQVAQYVADEVPTVICDMV